MQRMSSTRLRALTRPSRRSWHRATAKPRRWRMSGLLYELRQLLDDSDPAWYAFGLNRPIDPEVPVSPTEVAVTAGLPGSVHVTWKSAPRAARYRVYKKEEGDAEFIATT